jgi:hypothetical protein
MLLTSSLPGIVLSRDWHSTKQWLAYEAADAGLLSPELAAGIHRVKGVRKLGSRLGNWLTADEASALWQLPYDVACQPGETEPAGEKAGENCVGDTAQNLFASQAATAKQIETMKPDLVALVGDEQYRVGQYADFENSYESTYSAFKMITRPAPGNHEFYVEHGAIGVAGYGYFSYFNGVQHNADGTVMTATVANNPDTGGTFTQPVPYSDDRRGTSSSPADSETQYRRGAKSESEMAGIPTIWAPGTSSRSISSGKRSRTVARAPGLLLNSHG